METFQPDRLQNLRLLNRKPAKLTFIALAPLDVFLGEDPAHAAANGFAFMTLGVSLFAVALYVERRRLNVS